MTVVIIDEIQEVSASPVWKFRRMMTYTIPDVYVTPYTMARTEQDAKTTSQR